MGPHNHDPRKPHPHVRERDWSRRRRTRRKRQPAAPPPSDADRAALIERIVSGKSSLDFDLSNLLPQQTWGTDEAKIAEVMELRERYVAHLRELAKTEAGFKLLSELADSRFQTTIKFMHGTNPFTAGPPNDMGGVDGTGSDAAITVNPFQNHVYPCRDQNQAWMTESERYTFYHELVHAMHMTKGTVATGSTGAGNTAVENDEWQAVGLGPYAKEPISENVIRAQMGKELRPNYGGRSYDGTPC